MSEKKYLCSEPFRAGPAWAALDEQEQHVLAVRTKWAPHGTDYEKYRTSCLSELEKIGRLRVGEIRLEDGTCYFVRTHTDNRKANLADAKRIKSESVKGSGRHLAALNSNCTRVLAAFPVRAPNGTDQAQYTNDITKKLSDLGRVQLGTFKQEGDEFWFYWTPEKNR